MSKYSASLLGLAAALAFSANAARAADAEDVAIDVPVEVKDPAIEIAVDPVVDVAEPVDVKLDDPVDMTRAGDDGIIGETERTVGAGDPLENPDVIFYTMGAGFDPVEQAAETAAEQAAQQVSDRVADQAAANDAPVPAETH